MLPLVVVLSLVVNRICGYTTCLSCSNAVLPRDCTTIERCGPSSICFTDAHVTQLGTVRYNIGCRDAKQCTGHRHARKKKSQVSVFCSECCTGSLCNSNGCHTKGFPLVENRGPICFNCPSQQTVNDCQVITICGLTDVCKLKRTLYGNGNEIRYVTQCEHRDKCNAEVNFYKPSSPSSFFVGRRRESAEIALGNTCMVQCCSGDLCNIGCNNTSPTMITTEMPTPVKKPTIDMFTPGQTTVKYPLGSAVIMKCASKSLPVPTIMWSRRRDMVSSVVVHGGTLIITALQPSQLGNYTCMVKNAYGTSTKTITILSNVTDALDCSFDHLDTCLWFNNPLDNGEWVNSGKPTLTGAVPIIDPNRDSGTGNFLFSSSKAKQPAKVVDLISPELGHSGPACLSFLFKISRDLVQYLQIEAAANCEGYTICDDSDPKTVLLHRTRAKQKGWHLAQVDLPAIPHNHRLIIKSIHDMGVQDDDYCAVDNIKYYDGKCKSSMTISGFRVVNVAIGTNTELRLHCGISGFPTPTYSWHKYGGCGNFENSTGEAVVISSHAVSGDGGTYVCSASNSEPDHTVMSKTFHVTVSAVLARACTLEHGLCGWTQDVDDDFDWSTNSGSTVSKFTGPDVDNTLATANGTYLYVEASSPRVHGESAALRSHRIAGNQSVCFSFFYHMYGNDTERLSVSIEDTCSHHQHILFTRDGNLGNKWLFQSVDIPDQAVPRDYHIIIKGTIGKSYHGDIAIDDLLIKDGKCV